MAGENVTLEPDIEASLVKSMAALGIEDEVSAKAEAKAGEESDGKIDIDADKLSGDDDRNKNEPAAKEAEKPAAEKQLSDKEAAEKYPSLARTITRLSEREAKIAQLEKQLEEKLKAEHKPVANNQLAFEFKRDPLGALQKLGFDEDTAKNVIRMGMARSLGDKAPENYKKLLEKNEIQTEFEQLKNENAALREEFKRRDQEVANQKYVQQYNHELESYMEGAEQECPLVYRLRGADKQSAMTQIMEIVMQDAQSKLAAGKTNAAPLSPAEAVKVLEARLDKLRAAFGSADSGVKNSMDAGKNAAKSVNLGNKVTRPTGGKESDEDELPINKQVDLYLQKHLGF